MFQKYSIYFTIFITSIILGLNCSSKDDNDDEVAAAALLALSQQSSSSSASTIVTGTITDSSSSALASANLAVSTSASVQATSTKASVDSSATTDSYGFFTLNLAVKTYYITVTDSDGTEQGKFTLSVTSTTDTPTAEVTSGSIQVNSLRAVESSTGSTTELVLYPVATGSGFSSGNLGGRDGADTICSNQKPSSLTSCSSVAAMLSFSSSDQVKDMPTVKGFSGSIPLKAWNGSSVGDQVVADWNTIFSSSTPFSPILSTAMNLSGNTIYMMTGTNLDGTVNSSNNCSGFTSSSGDIYAVDILYGGTYAPESQTGKCSDAKDLSSQNMYLICVCY